MLRGALSLRLRAEDYIYQTRIKFVDPSDPLMNPVFDRKLQNDLLFSVGLSIGFAR